MLTNPYSSKTAGTTTIGATETNAAGVAISNALDSRGGMNRPTTPIEIGGSEGLVISETAGLEIKGTKGLTVTHDASVTGDVNIDGELEVNDEASFTDDVNISGAQCAITSTVTNISHLLNCTQTGPYVKSGGNASTAWRVGAIVDDATPQTISSTSDEFVIPDLHGNNLDVRLSASAAANSRIRIVRVGTSSGGRDAFIKNASAVTLATIDGGGGGWVELTLRSGAWGVSAWGGITTVP